MKRPAFPIYSCDWDHDEDVKNLVAVLRTCGASVLPLHRIGGGCPDLLVGIRGVDQLVEIKRGDLCKSAQQRNPLQLAFARKWKGRAVVVLTSIDDAYQLVGVVLRNGGL